MIRPGLAVAFVVAASLAAAPWSAAAAPAPTDVEVGMSECGATLAAEGSEDSARYVQASSPEEADRILDDMECAALRGIAAPTPNYGPCWLKPSAVYLRKSSGYLGAGSKPLTECSYPIISIEHANDIRYKWYTVWKKAGGTTRAVARGVKRMEQKNINKTCQGDTNTTFIGVTLGTVNDGGRIYYARAYTKVARLRCTM